MAVQRDISAEERAVGAFRAANSGKLPDLNNPTERATVYKMAYPPMSGGLPAELQGTVDEALYNSGTTPKSAVSATNPENAMPTTSLGADTSNRFGAALNQAGAAVSPGGQFSASNVNEFGRLLQDSIRRASGYTNQNVQLGESDTFKQAGLTGYNVLQQSLQTHSNEMIKNAGDLSRLVSDISGIYKAQAEDKLNEFNTTAKLYEQEANRLADIAKQAQEQKNQLELIAKGAEVDRQKMILDYALRNGVSEEEASKALSGNLFTESDLNQYKEKGKYDFSIGTGTITGFGSPAWQYGLDYYLDGGQGVPIKSFGDGLKVVGVVDEFINNTGRSLGEAGRKQNNGFGNQVKVYDPNTGVTLWFSHLDSVGDINGRQLKVGDVLNSGDIIGSQGNTGYTLGKKGVHVDITAERNGKKLSAREVAAYLGGSYNTLTKQGELTNEYQNQAMNTILGSAKMTADQADSFKNSLKNSSTDEQRFAIIKNNAKMIMSGASRTDTEKWETAKSELVRLDELLKEFYSNNGKTNIFTGTYEDALSKLGEVKDEKLRTIASEINVALQGYRNAVSGTAYSIQEGSQIAAIFPGITKTEGLNKAILKGTIGSFENRIDSRYREMLGTDVYNNLKKMAGETTETNISKEKTPSASTVLNYSNADLLNSIK